ncbi:LANO_0H16512g1_1 [Lachancea nothofagi CBS 11611]|uniref:LANO_0H16512g1_1 n=1 Tax=Lachancea nothofagi CBS 11611 TaxID=1266666 RepID=A0A1G4KMS0_9SACH|nr:LANO_0H16512g1_1 [Lachancea nothofagi CBS 11611]
MSFRDALKSYILTPEEHSEDVIFHDSQVVIIKDRFPKSKRHLLVLPRDLKFTKTKPWALSVEERENLQQYIDLALDHIFQSFTKEHKWRPTKSMPFETEAQYQNRQFFVSKFTQVGVHCVPSLNNLHIHVMTQDFHSDRLKNKKHFNSFTTEFFVKWEELPLVSVDTKHMENNVIKKSDLVCPYCSENFKNRFSQLKLHLDHEFRERFN